MTLRELINNLGVNKTFPSNFGENDISNPDEFSSSELKEYFNSTKFQNDILHCMEDVHHAKQYGYSCQDFYLYLSREVNGKIFIGADVLKH